MVLAPWWLMAGYMSFVFILSVVGAPPCWVARLVKAPYSAHFFDHPFDPSLLPTSCSFTLRATGARKTLNWTKIEWSAEHPLAVYPPNP